MQQQRTKEILLKRISFQWGVISLLSVALFFVLQIISAEAYDNTAHPLAVTSEGTSKYVLTVNGGTGSGSYAAGEKVTVAASYIYGKTFDKWTGDSQYTAKATGATTTVTMPAKAVTLTATYKSVSVKKASMSTVRYCFWPRSVDPASYEPDWNQMDAIIYFRWGAGDNGSLTPPDITRYETVRKLARQHNKKFIIAIIATDEGVIDDIIANHKTEFASNVLDMLKTYEADGVNIDFEAPSVTNTATNTSNTPLVEDFFKTLREKLGSGYSISLDAGQGAAYCFYNNKNLSQYIDFIMHMGYDYAGFTYSGPNSPYNDSKRTDVKDVVNNLLKYYPAQKIVLGVPLYGYEAQTDSDQPKAKVTAGSRVYVDMKTAMDRAEQYGRIWDSSSNTPWYKYQSGSKWYQGWYDDGESLKLKYDYVKSAKLAGIGFWALGYEKNYPDVWSEIFSAQKYALTVKNGSGSGSYAANTKVEITANTVSGKTFSKWTGDTKYLSSTTSATATVTMPEKKVSIVANYKNDSCASTYLLTVKNGTGSGSYACGTKVAITANPAISEKVFDKWTGDTRYVSDASSASAVVTMPGKAVTLVATYKTVPSDDKHILTVKNGTGSGSYAANTKVEITANTVSGKTFSKWTGDTKYVSDIYSSSATFTMPEKTATVTASYKDTFAQSLKATILKNDATVEKGATGVKLIEATLANTGTETLTVSGLGIMADFGASYFTNPVLYIDGKEIGKPDKTKSYEAIYKSLSISIESGKSATIMLKADVSSKLNRKARTIRLDSCTNVFTVKGATTNKKARITMVNNKAYVYFAQ